MALTVQNLRAVGTGVEPASLLPGQIAFNITDKVIYVGDGSSFKTAFDGTQAVGVPGEGWYAMPMDFASLGDYYVANPLYYGDTPTDQQVLTWSTTLNHPVWTSGGGGGGNQVYVVTNAQVASASGTTTSDKITAAIGVASPDEGDVTIVTGIPDDVYEGLYFFTTEWVKGAAYAYPSASEVIYDNTAHPTLTPTVQGAIDDLDSGLAATTAIANTANSTATSALSIANAALPKAGGTMTGTIVSRNINVSPGYFVQFASGANGSIDGISDSVVSASSTTAASSAAVLATSLVANAALPKAGGTMTGAITFAAGQVFPISGIQIASAGQLGVVQVGTNINVTAGGVISVNTGTISTPGIVQLVNDTITNDATQALTAAMGYDLQVQINGLSVATNVDLGGSLDCVTGLVDSVTAAGIAAGLTLGNPLPAPALGNIDVYVIVTTGAASYTPPGGGGTYAPENGDWFLSNGTIWQYLGVGARPSYASTTTAGIIQLGLVGDVQAGLNNTLAVTPLTLQSKVSDSTSTTSSTTIASSTAVKSAYDLGFAALPKAGGTMTGDITLSGAGVGIVFNNASTVEAISDSTSTTSSVTAASSTAVKSAYDLANSALQRAGGTMTGAITFVAGQTFPVSGIQDATTGQKGVVQVGTNIQVSSGTISVNTATTGQQGVVQVGSNIDVASGTISVKSASTTQAGVVQLNDTVASTSTTQALTANQGYQLQQQINALSTATNLTFAGTIDGSTGNMATVTTEGAGVGFTVGSPLPAPSATIDEYFVIVTTAGTMTPTGGSSTAVVVGDWFLASASTWTYIAAGFVAHLASTTTAGIVELATNGETQAGVNSTNAVTPSALQSKVSDSTSTTSSIAIASSTAVKSAYDLANAAVPKACYTALGALTAGTGSGTVGTLSVGSNGQVLFANTACSTGLEWCTISLACVPCSAYTGKGVLLAGTGTSTFTALPVGTNGQVLVPNSSCAAGLEWITTSALSFQGYTCTATPFNTAFGALAGDSITTGQCNTSVGYNAGTSITTGFANVLVGSSAGTGVSVQSDHVAIGNQTLVGTLDINNSGLTAVGTCALRAVTTGLNNIGIGFRAGLTITSGGCNIAIGACALDSVTSSANNIGIGFCSLTSITSGSENMGIGTLAGASVSSGANNYSIGYLAGCAVSTGTDNIFLGDQAGRNTTGSFNVFLGGIAGCGVTSGTCSIAIGYDALNSTFTGTQAVAIGRSAGTNLTSGSCSTLIGHSAGAGNTTSCNTAVGWCALATNTTGSCNTVVGIGAGQQGATPGSLVAVGHTAAQSANNTGTVAIGRAALQNATTGVNTAIGYFALQQHITAANSTAVGYQAGCAATGGGHTLIGNNSGCAITTGTNNTIVGPYIGTTTLTNNVVLADGSANIRFQANSSGAWSYNGVNFGNAGDTLQSGGAGAPPTWVSGASGTFTSQDGKTITVTNGLITSIV